MLLNPKKVILKLVSGFSDSSAKNNKLCEIDELKQKVEFYESILNHLPNDLVVFDTAHTYKFINPAAIRDENVRNFVMNKTDYDYCTYKNIDKILADDRHSKFKVALQTKEPFVWEDEREVNGLPVIIHRTFMPVFDTTGNVKHVLGYGQDITELRINERKLKEKAKSLSLLNTMLKEKMEIQQKQHVELDGYKKGLDLTTIISVTDSEGIITHVNKIFCETSKYEEQEIIGKTHKLIDSGYHTRQFFTGMWDTIKAGRTWNAIVKNRAKDGSHYWVDSTIVPFITEQGETLKYMCIARDITELMGVQSRIEYINSELEGIVKERTEKLEKANDNLEGFVYAVTHDLRSPLHTMSGYASLIEKYLPENVNPDVKEMLGVVKSKASKMNNIITDLLKLAHISKKELEKKRVNLNELIRNIIKEIQQDSNAVATQFNLEHLDDCIGDEGMCAQVWVNLISNAVKYSSKVENPVVSIGMTRNEQGESLYFIHDNGAGFDSKTATDLFKPFRRMHREDEFEGTGLGLSIVKNIVTAHGLEIWAESQPNKGCTFFIGMKRKANESMGNGIIKQLAFRIPEAIAKSEALEKKMRSGTL